MYATHRRLQTDPWLGRLSRTNQPRLVDRMSNRRVLPHSCSNTIAMNPSNGSIRQTYDPSMMGTTTHLLQSGLGPR